MDISKLNKMKKILFFLLFVIVVFMIIFGYFKFSEYKEEKRCLDSDFIANNEVIWIQFDSSFTSSELKNMTVEILDKEKLDIKLYKVSYFKQYEFPIKTKILKTDTLLLRLKNREFKIYNFKNGGIRQIAGQNKGIYYCGISELKINSKLIDNQGTTTIYLEDQN
jgi:hypothetical protein